MIIHEVMSLLILMIVYDGVLWSSLYTQSLAFSGVVCVSFEYNMYGFGIGRLTVFTSYRGKTSPVFSLYGNQGPQWIAAQLNVTIAYAEKVLPWMGRDGRDELGWAGMKWNGLRWNGIGRDRIGWIRIGRME